MTGDRVCARLRVAGSPEDADQEIGVPRGAPRQSHVWGCPRPERCRRLIEPATTGRCRDQVVATSMRARSGARRATGGHAYCQPLRNGRRVRARTPNAVYLAAVPQRTPQEKSRRDACATRLPPLSTWCWARRLRSPFPAAVHMVLGRDARVPRFLPLFTWYWARGPRSEGRIGAGAAVPSPGRRSVGPTGQRIPAWGRASASPQERWRCLGQSRPKVCRPNGPENTSLGQSVSVAPGTLASPCPIQAEGLSAQRARGTQPGAERQRRPRNAERQRPQAEGLQESMPVCWPGLPQTSGLPPPGAYARSGRRTE
jgi:hypothetical protein